MIFVITRK